MQRNAFVVVGSGVVGLFLAPGFPFWGCRLDSGADQAAAPRPARTEPTAMQPLIHTAATPARPPAAPARLPARAAPGPMLPGFMAKPGGALRLLPHAASFSGFGGAEPQRPFVRPDVPAMAVEEVGDDGEAAAYPASAWPRRPAGAAAAGPSSPWPRPPADSNNIVQAPGGGVHFRSALEQVRL